MDSYMIYKLPMNVSLSETKNPEEYHSYISPVYYLD